jgi:hypothetical protein
MNCNAPIDDQRHPSIVRTADKQLERYDYCAACWEHLKNDAFESFWLARRERSARRAPRLNRRQRSAALRALFESLRERAGEEDMTGHLFLISHLLMKWGGLKWRENQAALDGAELVVFEDPASGERYEVPSIDIADEQLVRIKAEIEDFLAGFAADPGDGESAGGLAEL